MTSVITAVEPYYITLINDNLRVKNAPQPMAEVITLQELHEAVQVLERADSLAAPFQQKLVFDPETKTATFSGIRGNTKTGFDILLEDKAENIESIEQARTHWGLDIDLVPEI